MFVAGCLVAVATVGGIAVNVASAHKREIHTKLAFVSGSQPGTHAVQVSSNKRKCFRARHVSWYRADGVLVYANDADANGIAEPQQPFAAEPGDYATVGKRILKVDGAHKHVCRKAKTTFG